MANTYSQMYVQVVFAVQGRRNLIESDWKEELYRYITGTIQNRGNKLIAIGGVEDHIHILFGFHPSQSLSDLVRDIKVSSTKFVNRNRFVRTGFHWQEGFGAFTYSRSQIPNVAKYIENQEVRHGRQSFKDEYHGLLKGFRVEYDDRYLFEWIE